MTNESFLMMLFNCTEDKIETLKTISKTMDIREILEVICQCGWVLSFDNFVKAIALLSPDCK